MTFFSPNHYQKIKAKMPVAFERFREQLIGEFPDWSNEDPLLSHLEEALRSKDLREYNPLKLHWLKILDDLLFLYDIHEAYEEAEAEKDSETKNDINEELFEFWNNSEFTEQFKEFLQEGNYQASQKLTPLIEQQAFTYYHLHLSSKDAAFDEPLIYTAVPEIGDSPASLYLGFPSQRCHLPQNKDIYPAVSLKGKSQEELTLHNEETCSIEVAPNTYPNHDIDLKLIEMEDSEKLDKEKIKTALTQLKELSPDTFNALKVFTHTIVPVNEKGIVSYSVQSLPGFSSINLFDRDEIDVLDDLIHENGHHIMNHFLTEAELIIEDDDKIFYSPWRSAKRPIRGIYHGALTFFWALKLFADLGTHPDREEHYSPEQLQKIYFRGAEEWEMLQYSRKDLTKAYQLKKVTDAGKELVERFYQEIDALRPQIEQLTKELDSEKESELQSLKSRLQKSRSEL